MLQKAFASRARSDNHGVLRSRACARDDSWKCSARSSHLQHRRHRHMIRRPLPAAGVAGESGNRGRCRRARGRPRCGRAGGRGRRWSSRRRDSSTRYRLFPTAGFLPARRRSSRLAPAPPSSFSHSIGVCDTTFNNCRCDHTSCSCGATLRSPTRTWRSSPRGCSGSHAFISSRNCSLCWNFGLSAGSGISPPAGT